MHGESERVFELMSSASLSQNDAKAWLEHAVREELIRINRRRLVELDDRQPNTFESNRLLDELATHSYRLLADKGANAALDPNKDAKIATRKYSEVNLARGRDMLDLFRLYF